MKGTSDASSGIVHHVLTKDNYEKWKVVMQNYLRGQGLWDVVESTANSGENDANALHIFQLSRGRDILETAAKKSWNHGGAQNGTPIPDIDIEQGLWGVVQSVSEVETKASRNMRDAKALHIIQLSCGREILDDIIHFNTVKEAWNHLSKQYGKELKATPDTEQAILDDSLGNKVKELFRKVERGDDIGDIGLDIDICLASASGKTLLHVAVIAGNVSNVEKLVKEGKRRLVGMKDNRAGNTALALAAQYTGNTEIAKCIVEKSRIGEELLAMQNKEEKIPLLLAAANGHKEMTSYLYYETPRQVLEEEHSKNRVLLLSLCITAEIFDVALRLLQRYPNLPRESLSTDKFSALNSLSKLPSVFPSGSRFGFRKRYIYNILSVEREFQENYGIPDIANFVQAVTCVTDGTSQKTSFAGRSVGGFHIPILNFLLKFVGRFCILVLKILLLPIKLLGRLLGGIVYVLVHIFNFLNIFGIRDIYVKKYTHYEVLGILHHFYQSIAEFNDSQLKEALAYDAMLHAAQHGIIEFINAMRKANPDLLLAIDSCNRGIFEHAILNRKQNVFQLIHGLNGRKEIFKYRRDVFRNNLLHLAAHLGPSSDRDTRSGAALQMQREIQWFKAVEKVVHPKCKEAKNDDDKKPHELFTENHEELVKAGEKWAKDTAGSFTLVATLITTVMFAAAFTVPGGNNQETGVPIFLHDTVFTTFLIADAISLFTSAASVLIFIGILTSRYAEKDFLTNLPFKLLFGLLFLFLSVCSMIVAFCAVLAMILKGYRAYRWIVIGSTMTLGTIPLIVLVVSQLRLMHEIFHSTKSNAITYIKKEQ